MTPLLLLAACSVAQAATPALRSVHVEHHGAQTRVIFAVSSVPAFHGFALGTPPRAVLDLHDTRNDWHRVPLSDGAIRDVRLARHLDGTLRVVLDLRHGAHLTGVRRGSGQSVVMQIYGGATRTTMDTDAAAKLTDIGPAPHRGPVVVVIDPGHGGRDPGTRGPYGLREKTVTLGIARRLFAKLARQPGIQPVLTRDHDTYVSLQRRVAIAQQDHANLFVSIHENASPDDPAVDGGACYVLSPYGASDAKAAQLARFENKADPQIAGVHFSSNDQTLNAVLTDVFQTASINAADHLADDIIARLGQVEPLYHRRALRANFEVLRDPMIPSVLCETAFLSNPTQARQLRSQRFQSDLADAIAGGILRYLKTYAPAHGPAGTPGTYTASSHDLRPYVVQRGDTLSAMALRYHSSVQQLQTLNGLNGSNLQVGQKLRVPATAAHGSRRYVVQKGDTLSEIAQRLGVNTQQLEDLNDLQGANINVGQTLQLPGDNASSS